jgi:hypothetical protein
MIKFKQFVTELHGKKSLRGTEQHHHDKARSAKKGSASKEFHVHQAARAGRMRAILNKKVADIHVGINKQYNKEDRKKAHDAKARSKPSDYR